MYGVLRWWLVSLLCKPRNYIWTTLSPSILSQSKREVKPSVLFIWSLIFSSQNHAPYPSLPHFYSLFFCRHLLHSLKHIKREEFLYILILHVSCCLISLPFGSCSVSVKQSCFQGSRSQMPVGDQRGSNDNEQKKAECKVIMGSPLSETDTVLPFAVIQEWNSSFAKTSDFFPIKAGNLDFHLQHFNV